MTRPLLILLLIIPTLATAQEKLSSEEILKKAREMARLEGDIKTTINEYDKRPRLLFVSGGAADETIESYVQPILQKIERIGTYNYPTEARGTTAGVVTVKFNIYADGTLRDPVIIKSSGYEMLDKAAQQAVRMASPANSFPLTIRARADVLVMTQTFNFIKAPAPQ